jgi:hypothetical protein
VSLTPPVGTRSRLGGGQSTSSGARPERSWRLPGLAQAPFGAWGSRRLRSPGRVSPDPPDVFSRSWQNGFSPVKLRNAHLAVVERHKIVDYLLNSAHPDNGGKAQFFVSLGFSVDASELLTIALRVVAQTGEVVESIESSMARNMLSTARCRRKLRAATAGW